MNKIVFFVGESGCGKSYAQETLIRRYPSIYTRIISTTTRPPREEEINHIHYHFVELDEERMRQGKTSEYWFNKMIDRNELLQYVEYGDTFYGTTVFEYCQQQDVGIFVCTPEGINDTINAVKTNNHLKDMDFEYEIVYWMATKDLLKRHGISQERIERGSITENFTKRYYENEFSGINLTVIPEQDVNINLPERLHRVIA